MTKSYNADSIQVLEDLEHVRLRPAMYIGSTDEHGVRHILKELIDNGIDEHLAGHASELVVDIDSREQIFTVTDNGRGIPVENHAKTGESTLITVFTNLQAGGKFSSQAYAVSAGLHGVGLKATNSLSEWLEARVWRSGVCYLQKFSRGTAATKKPVPDKALNERGRTGTSVRFKPDPQIFGEAKLNIEDTVRWLDEVSHLCPGFRVRVTIDGKEQVFQSDGLDRLVKQRAVGTVPLHDPILIMDKDNTVSFSLLWGEGEGENWFSACNASSTPEGGKHVDGATKAIGKVLLPFAKKKELDVKDVSDGLVAAIHVLVREPSFKSQTKEKLLNPEVRDRVFDIVYPQLKAYFDQNKKLAEKIVSRALELKKARDQYKKLRAVVSQTSTKREAKGILPDKLVEVLHCKPEARELYLVEGDSAGGSSKLARDPKCQEILPLKGKIPNAIQTSPDKLFKNSEISAMMKAIGVGFDPKTREVDYSNIRVGKILIMTDADQDGSHIASLILGLFCTWFPGLVERGLIYAVDSPLFVGVHKDQRWFGHSLKELEEVSSLPSSKLQVTRLKGHGESSADEVRQYAMNPSTRKLWKISLGSNDRDVILELMGSDSSARKILLGLS